MHQDNFHYNNNQDHNGQVHWNGSAYSTNHYRVEDVKDSHHGLKKFKKGKGSIKIVALALCCALIGGGAGVGGAALYDHLFAGNGGTTTIYENTTVPSTTVNVQQADGLTLMSLTEIYEAYANSSVVISCQVPYTTNTWFGPSSGTAASSGSGFIISNDGYVVTNYHVIEGASEIKVTLFDGTEYTATYVGGEEANDVAVLKMDATGLTPVVLGDSDTLSVGETVCTIGNALGTLSFSQTSGAISGLGRSVTYANGTVINMIQTDCTINEGNSGGPLFDQYGRVVGITSAKYSNNANLSAAAIENIGFAIPINDVRSVITDIMEHGYVIRPYMGIINPATVTENYAQAFGWPNGVYVNDVEADSCAEIAGIKKGDIITKLGDTEVASVAELTAAKNQYSVGDTVELTVYRSGEYLTMSITFDASENPTAITQEQPAQQQEGGQYESGQGGYFPFGYGY